MDIPNSYKNFSLIQTLIQPTWKLFKYQSTKTGMTAAIAQFESPTVTSYITIPTQPSSHEGLPHVLEHMTFLGSEEYPYKGFLDHVANKVLADGTNAYTAIDHTSYFLVTAGQHGMKQTLPVYLDSVFFPTLTDTSFLTEIHHVNGKGKDEGVVYSEMESCLTSASSIVSNALKESLFPTHNYRWEYGGKTDRLRELNVDLVRKFHSEQYHPSRVCILVTGNVDVKAVIDTISPFEEKFEEDEKIQKLQQIQVPNDREKDWWKTPVPDLKESISQTVHFPSDDEASGALVSLGYLATPWTDILSREKIQIILKYLSDSSVAPLQKEFVQCADPIVGFLDCFVYPYSKICFGISFGNMNPEKTKEIVPKYLEKLERIVSGKERIDMERIADLVKQTRLTLMDEVESHPHEIFSEVVFEDFLYADKFASDDTILRLLGIGNELDTIYSMKEEDWREFVDKWFLKNKFVSISGHPSKKLAQDAGEEENNRIKRQAEALGEEKLKEIEESLEQAQDSNSDFPDDSALDKFTAPDPKKIQLFDIKEYSSSEEGKNNQNSQILKEKLHSDSPKPFPFSFSALNTADSQFCTLRCFFDCSKLSFEEKMFMELYLDLFFELPVSRKNPTTGEMELISHEIIARELEKNSLLYYNGAGLSSSAFETSVFSSLFFAFMKVENTQDKYENGIKMLRENIFSSVFTQERLQVSISKLLADVARLKTKPFKIARAAMNRIIFAHDKSMHIAMDFFTQSEFLAELLKKVSENPEETISKLNDIRKKLIDPSRLRIMVCGDLINLPSPKKPWLDFIPSQEGSNTPAETIEFEKDFENLKKENVSGKTIIMGCSSTDSSCLISCSKSLEYSSFGTKEFAALTILIELLTRNEGPIWERVRGAGLSYAFDLGNVSDQERIKFLLKQSTNVVEAYSETRDIIHEFIGLIEDGEDPFEEDLETAKTCTVFHLINENQTKASASTQRMITLLRGFPNVTFNSMLENFLSVTSEDLEDVFTKIVVPLFEKTSSMVIVTNPAKVEEIKKGMKKLDRQKIVVHPDSSAFFKKE